MVEIDVLMQVMVSVVLLLAALFVILSNKYDATTKDWAYAVVALIAAFWLRRRRRHRTGERQGPGPVKTKNQ